MMPPNKIRRIAVKVRELKERVAKIEHHTEKCEMKVRELEERIAKIEHNTEKCARRSENKKGCLLYGVWKLGALGARIP